MKSVVIGTAGHIDHGKSALVRALTGTDPDRLKEEQERGITIDLGFAHWNDEEVNLAFVDVPGHERFVRNMLAGVGGFDAVVLVVAADESVMPQTREHFEICRLLHIREGVVVLTKSDLVDADTLELVRMEVRELVSGSFLEDAPIIAASSKTGEGLDQVRDALLDIGRGARVRPIERPARLPVDRVFSVRGFGTVATGTLVSGSIGLDDEMEVLPQRRRVKVRGIQVHGERRERADAGERVALNLGGVEVSDLSRGETLAAPWSLETTRMLDATVEVVAGARPLRHATRVRFHQGTSEVLGRVAISGLAGSEPAPAPVPEVAPGERGYIRLRLESPAVLTRGDRYILRAYSPPVTIAGGEILDPAPPRGGIRSPGARRRFRALDPSAPLSGDASAPAERALVEMTAEAGTSGLPVSAVVSRAGFAPARGREVVARLVESGSMVGAGDRLVQAALCRQLGEKLVRALSEYHRVEPLSGGMPREEARERFFSRAAPGLFDVVIADLVAQNKIEARDRLALAGHSLSLSPAEERARERIERAFREGGLKPPDVAALAPLAGNDAGLADRMVKLLLRQKVLTRVDALVFHEEALRTLREDMAALKREHAGAKLDVGSFKDRYGVSRKYAIPLLEYLDRERVTRRVGDTRVLI
jgi:selenocysteine-specific elongation factor